MGGTKSSRLARSLLGSNGLGRRLSLSSLCQCGKTESDGENPKKKNKKHQGIV